MGECRLVSIVDSRHISECKLGHNLNAVDEVGLDIKRHPWQIRTGS